MKHLTIKLKEIHCKDPQDPKRDELYFITATNDSSKVTDAIRKIKRGEKKLYNELIDEQRVLFDGNFNELSPVVITAIEQRAIQDESAISEQLEAIAGVGVTMTRRNIETRMVNKSDLYKQIIRLLMDNITNLFKHVFRDSSLGKKVIANLSEEGVEYPVEYVMPLYSGESPTYDYEIKLEVTVS